MSRYRIAMVVDHFLPRIGGIEMQVSDLARHLTAAGHDVTIVTTTPGDTAAHGVPVVRVPASLTPRYQVVWNRAPLVRVARVLADGRFDIVHCHSSIYSPVAYAALVACQRLRLPTMLTVHSMLKNSARVLRAFDPLYGWRRWPTVWSTVSNYNAAQIRRRAGLAEVAVIPNGIEPSDWHVEHRPQASLRVVSVLRLNRKKRPHDLIRAISAVLEQRRTSAPVKFTVVGNGPLRDSVERLARRLGVAEHVEFLGSLSRAAIREVFETADLMVHPTRTEAFGIAVLEALAAGLPTVAMDDCGVTDLIRDGHEGLLAQDSRQFAHGIARLLDDAALRSQMSATARETAATFSWQRLIPLHVKMYELAMARSQRSWGGERTVAAPDPTGDPVSNLFHTTRVDTPQPDSVRDTSAPRTRSR